MLDIAKLKLGKLPAKVDTRTLRFAKYAGALPPPPIACDFSKGVTEWGLMLNNDLGDCVCAMIGHGVQVATLNSEEGQITAPDSIVQSLYENACGYQPSNANSDQGCVIVDVLNYVRQNAPWAKKKRYEEKGHKHPYQLWHTRTRNRATLLTSSRLSPRSKRSALGSSCRLLPKRRLEACGT